LRKEGPYAVLAIFLAVACIFIAGFLQACGKKGDPLTPRLVSPPAVTDLKASQIQGTVHLLWTMPDEKTDIVRIKLVRSVLETAGDECPGCPRKYEPLDDVNPRDSKIVREGGQRTGYVDAGVQAGRLYTYKIVLCGSSGNCGGESNAADIKIKE
jgi:hypothetical protein